MDFFDHQDQARRKTFWLVAVYACIVAAIVALVYCLAVAAVGSTDEGRKFLEDRLWNAQLFVWAAGFTLTTILVGNIYKTVQLSEGGASVARMLGGHLLDPGEARTGERMLLNIVEEMSIASGVPVPPVYVLDEEQGINAFAAGFRPSDAVIGVSRGSLTYLTRDELQGVIAHEFSHILNGDMRLNLRLIAILHGILLISYLGDAVMRLASETRYSRSHRSKRGGGELQWWAVGVGLQIIGFLGVFFGSLIKSRVSQQREFLADASAVQFTRNPDGIAGALKKIGGLAQGSKITNRHASQASHMFFGNAVESSFTDIFATHPPLPERIRRIDPQWDGAFPEDVRPVGLRQVSLSTAKISMDAAARPALEQPAPVPVLPLATAALLAGWHGSQGGAAKDLDVDAALNEVGAPKPQHLGYAAALLAELPERLRAAVNEPFGAEAVVLLVLFSNDPPVRARQLEYLRSQLNPGQMKQLEELLPTVDAVPAAARLPLVELSIMALRLLSDRQYRDFRARVQKLADTDQQISFFEYALIRSLERHLAAQFERRRPPRLKYRTLPPLLPASSLLLSILAHVGNDEKRAQDAFHQAVLVLSPGGGLKLHERRDLSVRRVDIALEDMALATPQLKRIILKACATCVAHDGKVTVEEGELLRAVADALDCPLPPLLSQAGRAGL